MSDYRPELPGDLPPGERPMLEHVRTFFSALARFSTADSAKGLVQLVELPVP
ncbi:hypothetical protein [Dactylosporangium sp. CA-092794]|uniref:hypothetical protein n=1 Tax=Dactylosporangium sp. CA-092794 TaxID=3239929 RepID=UPI003D9297A0